MPKRYGRISLTEKGELIILHIRIRVLYLHPQNTRMVLLSKQTIRFLKSPSGSNVRTFYILLVRQLLFHEFIEFLNCHLVIKVLLLKDNNGYTVFLNRPFA